MSEPEEKLQYVAWGLTGWVSSATITPGGGRWTLCVSTVHGPFQYHAHSTVGRAKRQFSRDYGSGTPGKRVRWVTRRIA